MKTNKVLSLLLSVLMLLSVLPMGVMAADVDEAYVSEYQALIGEAPEGAVFLINMEPYKVDDTTLAVKITFDGYQGLDLAFVGFNFCFDSDRMSLLNPVLPNNALDCATKLPGTDWENSTIFKRDSEGNRLENTIDVNFLTVRNTRLTETTPLELTFLFELKDGYTYGAVYVPSATVKCLDYDFNRFAGIGTMALLQNDLPSPHEGNLAYGKQYEISEQFRMGGADVGWGYDENAAPSYPDSNFELTDGYVPSGSDASYSSDCWMAFNKNTPAQAERGYAYIRMDLGEISPIKSISVTTLKEKSAGITCPYYFEYMVSEDGTSWQHAGALDLEGVIDSYADESVHTITAYLDATARYVEVRVYSYGWAFLGELEIYSTGYVKPEEPTPEAPDIPEVPDVPEGQMTYENTLVIGEDGNYTCKVPYGYTWNVDYIDGVICGEDVTVCTTQDAYNACNPNWAITLYVEKQADGTYVVLQDAIICPMSAEGAGISIGEKQLAIVVHSASSSPDLGYENWLGKVVACAVKAGDVLVIDMNAMTVYAPLPGGDEEPDVPEIVYGDANGDGVINGKDATLLLVYLANLDASTGESTVEVTAGADCNGDGKVNGRDATKLLQYLANYDPDTGTSSVVLGPAA